MRIPPAPRTHTLKSHILANVKILVRVVHRNAIYDHSHSFQVILIHAKTNQPDWIPSASIKGQLACKLQRSPQTTLYPFHIAIDEKDEARR
jgi:hypothetical protein